MDGRARAAGGLMIQLMPGHREETVAAVEQAVQRLPALSRSIDGGRGPRQLIGPRHVFRRPSHQRGTLLATYDRPAGRTACGTA